MIGDTNLLYSYCYNFIAVKANTMERGRLYKGVMVIVVEMDTATRVQILDETDCISHNTNTLGKGMNPIILPPPISK